MSTAVYVSLLLHADDTYTPRMQPHGDTEAIGSVDIEAAGRTCIQATDPQALRNLAAALIAAADLTDALIAARASVAAKNAA